MPAERAHNEFEMGIATGSRRRSGSAFTLAELMVVVVIVSLLVLMATINVMDLLKRNTFKGQIQDFVSTLQMAANAAAESDKRYEVIVDPVEQSYILREITTPELSQVLQEEIIIKRYLSENCTIDYIIFDDGEYATEGWAKFRASRTGWQSGGKIVLLDKDDQLYSILVNRLDRIIKLEEGDVGLLGPRSQDDIPF
ncbi:MAG: prepilin-type N-terminal cleavage/methylation domain-containing protein [Planctomycetota bacterium]